MTAQATRHDFPVTRESRKRTNTYRELMSISDTVPFEESHAFVHTNLLALVGDIAWSPSELIAQGRKPNIVAPPAIALMLFKAILPQLKHNANIEGDYELTFIMDDPITHNVSWREFGTKGGKQITLISAEDMSKYESFVDDQVMEMVRAFITRRRNVTSVALPGNDAVAISTGNILLTTPDVADKETRVALDRFAHDNCIKVTSKFDDLRTLLAIEQEGLVQPDIMLCVIGLRKTSLASVSNKDVETLKQALKSSNVIVACLNEKYLAGKIDKDEFAHRHTIVYGKAQ